MIGNEYVGKSPFMLDETGRYIVLDERENDIKLWFINDKPAVESEKWWESKKYFNDWLEEGLVERCPKQLIKERNNKLNKLGIK